MPKSQNSPIFIFHHKEWTRITLPWFSYVKSYIKRIIKGAGTVLPIKMRLILLFAGIDGIKQLTLLQCYKCHQIIHKPSFSYRLVKKCAIALLTGRCDAYRRASKDTSIYFWPVLNENKNSSSTSCGEKLRTQYGRFWNSSPRVSCKNYGNKESIID